MFKKIENMEQLAQKLNTYESISKFNSNNELEAFRLALSLADMESSFIEILNTHLPALHNANDETVINETLLDIGEELRHVLYHIKDARYFNYLLE